MCALASELGYTYTKLFKKHTKVTKPTAETGSSKAALNGEVFDPFARFDIQVFPAK